MSVDVQETLINKFVGVKLRNCSEQMRNLFHWCNLYRLGSLKYNTLSNRTLKSRIVTGYFLEVDLKVGMLTRSNRKVNLSTNSLFFRVYSQRLFFLEGGGGGGGCSELTVNWGNWRQLYDESLILLSFKNTFHSMLIPEYAIKIRSLWRILTHNK